MLVFGDGSNVGRLPTPLYVDAELVHTSHILERHHLVVVEHDAVVILQTSSRISPVPSGQMTISS